MSRSARRPKDTFRPRLEILEDRLALSCTVAPIDTDGNGSLDALRVIGDDIRQVVQVAASPSSGRTLVSLDCNGDGDFTDATLGDLNRVVLGNFSTIDIQLNGGDDTAVFTPTDHYNQFSQTVLVDLGDGKDQFELHDWPNPFTGGSNYPTLDQSVLRVQVQAGTGSDKIIMDDPPYIMNGSSYLVDVQLGTGNNTVRFNSDTAISGGSNLEYSYTGSNRASNVDKVYGTIIADVLDNSKVSYHASLLAGNDQFTATVLNNFNLTNAGAEAHLNVDGGEGNDTIVVTSKDKTDGRGLTAKGMFDIGLQGESGDDAITLDFTSGDGLKLSGDLILRADGGDGADRIDVRLKNIATSWGNYDLAIWGGAQDDMLSFSLDDPSAGKVKYRNTTTSNLWDQFILLDGGDGTQDQCTVTVSPSVPVQKVNCEL